LMLILDVKTRWTSTHQMLRRAVNNRQAINLYIKGNSDLADVALTDADWNALRNVREWLAAFRRATTEMSTTSKPMLSQTHLVFRMLQSDIKETLAGLEGKAMYPELITGLTDAHKKLSDYYFYTS
ncbi:hypothetical protein FB45DRAFT_755615, partial [Roridomyces roridus]